MKRITFTKQQTLQLLRMALDRPMVRRVDLPQRPKR
jgi:hypothetical protein